MIEAGKLYRLDKTVKSKIVSIFLGPQNISSEYDAEIGELRAGDHFIVLEVLKKRTAPRSDKVFVELIYIKILYKDIIGWIDNNTKILQCDY